MELQSKYDSVLGPVPKVGEGHCTLTEQTVACIQKVYDTVQPKRVLEIGFNAGHSAFGWLTMFPEIEYHSVDICMHEYTQERAAKVKELFGDRFMFGNRDSKDLTPDMIESYDMVFIDGDHTLEGLNNDYWLCHNAGTKWVLIDDYTLRQHIFDFLNHIDEYDKFPYKMVDKFKYTDQRAETTMVLFRRVDEDVQAV